MDLLPRLAAVLAARRTRIEAVLAREGQLTSPRVLHDLRVALRRTASLARLTRGFPRPADGEALRLAARDLRRALSPSRTHEVARARLLARFRRDASRRQTAVKLAGRMAARSPEAVGPSPEEARRLLARLRRAFAERDRDFARFNHPAADAPAQAAEARLKKAVLKRLRKRRRRLLGTGIPTAETLHGARILAKDLRYSLEPVRDVLPAAAALLGPLRDFQDAAGEAHDRAELVAEVRRIAGVIPRSRRRDALLVLPFLMGDAERSLLAAQKSARRLLETLRKKEFDWT